MATPLLPPADHVLDEAVTAGAAASRPWSWVTDTAISPPGCCRLSPNAGRFVGLAAGDASASRRYHPQKTATLSGRRNHSSISSKYLSRLIPDVRSRLRMINTGTAR